MSESRSIMEKSVRAAIQRHLRGWPPYPHVQVITTVSGHKVYWRDKKDILDVSKSVLIETVGVPSRRNFAIVSVTGGRDWIRGDTRMMDNDANMLDDPWAMAVPMGRINALSDEDCISMLLHLRNAWSKNTRACKLLDIIEGQSFTPANQLHAVLDTMAAASSPAGIYAEKENVAPLARIFLGHAMQSKRAVWACKFGHPEGKWSDMAIVVWSSAKCWNMAIVPQNNPVLFSDYHWERTQEGLIFYDTMPDNGRDGAGVGRGSYERYHRLYAWNSDLSVIHWEALYGLLSSPMMVIEPDTVWVRPLEAAMDKTFSQSTSISPEYYTFIRLFEERAFDSLSLSASTKKGLSLAACMTVSRSLDDPPKNEEELKKRFSAWEYAIKNTTAAEDDIVVDANLFEGLSL